MLVLIQVGLLQIMCICNCPALVIAYETNISAGGLMDVMQELVGCSYRVK